MATQLVIGTGDYIKIDDSFHIEWVNRGNAMPSLPNTVHAVLWNGLVGQNEIQNKDVNGNMTGNTELNSTSDVVGSITIADLLTWAETRKGEITAAMEAYAANKADAIAVYDAAVADDAANGTNNAEGKTWRYYSEGPTRRTGWQRDWIDYDPNYS
jgi:hypothetical protein